MNVRMASEIQQAKVLAHPSKRRKTEETLVHPELTKAENFEQQGVKMQVCQYFDHLIEIQRNYNDENLAPEKNTFDTGCFPTFF